LHPNHGVYEKSRQVVNAENHGFRTLREVKYRIPTTSVHASLQCLRSQLKWWYLLLRCGAGRQR